MKNDIINKKKIKERIAKEEDFIYCPKFKNSLKKLLDRYSDGVEGDTEQEINQKIGKVLLITPEEVDKAYKSAIIKLRKALGIGEEH
jgi:hypothetical protein